MTVAQLAPKPSIAQEAREDAGKIIADLMRLQEADDLAEIVVIVKHPNGSWSSYYSASIHKPEMIGRLEIAKQSMIRQHLDT
jgi:hypothetical protein